MAATNYPALKATLAGMLTPLIAQAVANGATVLHINAAFKQTTREERASTATSAGLRHFWFTPLAQREGALAVGTGPQHVVRDILLQIQYPSKLKDLDDTMGIDEDLVRARLQDTAFQGWPASGLMNVRPISGAPRISDTAGRVLVAHTLRVQYLAQTL